MAEIEHSFYRDHLVDYVCTHVLNFCVQPFCVRKYCVKNMAILMLQSLSLIVINIKNHPIDQVDTNTYSS